MGEINRWFKDRRGIHVRVIRWEPGPQRVIYLRNGYPDECFSPLQIFKRDFTEVEGEHESLNAIQANSNKP